LLATKTGLGKKKNILGNSVTTKKGKSKKQDPPREPRRPGGSTKGRGGAHHVRGSSFDRVKTRYGKKGKGAGKEIPDATKSMAGIVLPGRQGSTAGWGATKRNTREKEQEKT